MHVLCMCTIHSVTSIKSETTYMLEATHIHTCMHYVTAYYIHVQCTSGTQIVHVEHISKQVVILVLWLPRHSVHGEMGSSPVFVHTHTHTHTHTNTHAHTHTHMHTHTHTHTHTHAHTHSISSRLLGTNKVRI